MNRNRIELPSRKVFLQAAGAAVIGPMLGVFSSADLVTAQEYPAATSEQVRWVKKHGKHPLTMALSKLTNHTRVLGIGELPADLEMEEFGERVVRHAKQQKLINFLALEIDSNLQGSFDRFISTGERDNGVTSVLREHDMGYFRMLNTAREYNLPIVCVDAPNGEREAAMSQNIETYLAKHQSSKGIWYVSSPYLRRQRNPAGDNNYLAIDLKTKFQSIDQVNHQEPWVTIYQAAMQAGYTKPVGFDNLAHSPFALSAEWFNVPNSQYGQDSDAIVVHPQAAVGL